MLLGFISQLNVRFEREWDLFFFFFWHQGLNLGPALANAVQSYVHRPHVKLFKNSTLIAYTPTIGHLGEEPKLEDQLKYVPYL